MSNYLINFYLAVFGCIITASAIWSISLMANLIGSNYRYVHRILLVNLVYLASVAVDSVFAGSYGSLGHIVMVISNHLEYLSLYGLSAVMTYFQADLVKKNGVKNFKVRIFQCYYLIPVAFLIVSFFNHMYFYIGDDNLYHRGEYFMLSQMWGMIAQLMNLFMLIHYGKKYRKAERELFIYFFAIPIIALLLQTGLSLKLMIIATTLCCIQLILYTLQISRQEYQNRVLELERVRSTITYTQLHPHFLYNSLSSIAQLCRKDPGKASVISDQLAEFLRKSTNDMNSMELKTFDEELEHTKNYLDIDCVRYGEDLQVEYDIQNRGFMMPGFVLQQMVEVLIRFGFGRSDGEGLIRIASLKQDGWNVIIVSCEGGPGLEMTRQQIEEFNQRTPEDSALEMDNSFGAPKHPDLHTLEQIHVRLSIIPDSDLTVHIEPGHGTTLTVYIPGEPEEKKEPDADGNPDGDGNPNRKRKS